MNPLHTPTFWLNIVLDVQNEQLHNTHILHNYTLQIEIILDHFTFSVGVNNPWPNAIYFVVFWKSEIVT